MICKFTLWFPPCRRLRSSVAAIRRASRSCPLLPTRSALVPPNSRRARFRLDSARVSPLAIQQLAQGLGTPHCIRHTTFRSPFRSRNDSIRGNRILTLISLIRRLRQSQLAPTRSLVSLSALTRFPFIHLSRRKTQINTLARATHLSAGTLHKDLVRTRSSNRRAAQLNSSKSRHLSTTNHYQFSTSLYVVVPSFEGNDDLPPPLDSRPSLFLAISSTVEVGTLQSRLGSPSPASIIIVDTRLRRKNRRACCADSLIVIPRFVYFILSPHFHDT